MPSASQLVGLPPGMSVGDGLKAYRALESVAVVELNAMMSVEPPLPLETNAAVPPVAPKNHLVPNDPSYGSQSYLSRIGAPAAWDVTTGSRNVVVAVLDWD